MQTLFRAIKSAACATVVSGLIYTTFRVIKSLTAIGNLLYVYSFIIHFLRKLSNAFIFFFQDSEKSEGLYEKELNLEPLIFYS